MTSSANATHCACSLGEIRNFEFFVLECDSLFVKRSIFNFLKFFYTNLSLNKERDRGLVSLIECEGEVLEIFKEIVEKKRET